MKKLILPFLAVVLLFSGCSAKKAALEPSELAPELYNACVFSTEVTEVQPVVALQVYGLDEAAVGSGVFYFSSGASADELAVVKAADKTAAKTVAAAFEARVTAQKSSYADYMPQEVPKLEDAVVMTKGQYVILCVAEDSGSLSDVMDKYF